MPTLPAKRCAMRSPDGAGTAGHQLWCIDLAALDFGFLRSQHEEQAMTCYFKTFGGDFR